MLKRQNPPPSNNGANALNQEVRPLDPLNCGCISDFTRQESGGGGPSSGESRDFPQWVSHNTCTKHDKNVISFGSEDDAKTVTRLFIKGKGSASGSAGEYEQMPPLFDRFSKRYFPRVKSNQGVEFITSEGKAGISLIQMSSADVNRGPRHLRAEPLNDIMQRIGSFGGWDGEGKAHLKDILTHLRNQLKGHLNCDFLKSLDRSLSKIISQIGSMGLPDSMWKENWDRIWVVAQDLIAVRAQLHIYKSKDRSNLFAPVLRFCLQQRMIVGVFVGPGPLCRLGQDRGSKEIAGLCSATIFWGVLANEFKDNGINASLSTIIDGISKIEQAAPLTRAQRELWEALVFLERGEGVDLSAHIAASAIHISYERLKPFLFREWDGEDDRDQPYQHNLSPRALAFYVRTILEAAASMENTTNLEEWREASGKAFQAAKEFEERLNSAPKTASA